MTSASRATWNAAQGKNDKLLPPTKLVSARALPSHMFLKERKKGQDTAEEISKRDLKAALLEKERQYFEKKYGSDSYFATAAAHLRVYGHKDGEEDMDMEEDLVEKDTLAIEAASSAVDQELSESKATVSLKGIFLRDKDMDKDDDEASEIRSIDIDKEEDSDNEDEDSKDKDKDESSEDDSSEDESSEDEDDTAALLLELEKIKRERALEQAQREAETQKKDDQTRNAMMLSSNPLLPSTSSSSSSRSDFTVKRKWYDDVIFKNQAKGTEEGNGGNKKKRFINDLIRSDFHRKFMDKYVK